MLFLEDRIYDRIMDKLPEACPGEILRNNSLVKVLAAIGSQL